MQVSSTQSSSCIYTLEAPNSHTRHALTTTAIWQLTAWRDMTDLVAEQGRMLHDMMQLAYPLLDDSLYALAYEEYSVFHMQQMECDAERLAGAPYNPEKWNFTAEEQQQCAGFLAALVAKAVFLKARLMLTVQDAALDLQQAVVACATAHQSYRRDPCDRESHLLLASRFNGLHNVIRLREQAAKMMGVLEQRQETAAFYW